MATLTVYPQAGAGGGNVSCDGWVRRDYGVYGQDTWSNVRGATGATEIAYTTLTDSSFLDIYAGTSTNYWKMITRFFTSFDTSSLTASATISAATLSLNGGTAKNIAFANSYWHIVQSTQANANDVVTTDFDNVGTTSFGNMNFTSYTVGDNYNDIALNASGITNISKTGVSMFAHRDNWDLDNSEPSWSASADNYLQCKCADETGTSRDPKLVIEYTSPTTTTSTSTSTSSSTSSSSSTTSSSTSTSTTSSTSSTTTSSTSTSSSTTTGLYEILRPDGAGTYTEWENQVPFTGTEEHWEQVDEVVADGDTTRVDNEGFF